MNDYIYCYTKDTFKKVLLGEVQTDFNMGFAIDGTKDSSKVIVHSFSGVEIQPQTIIKHENTNTWWVVSHDKVERNTNETGYYYVHNLQLLGAIELLNARDLTDSGYNDRRYTIYQFISRLLKLSNFEFANNDYYNIEVISPYLDIDKVVDYIKTFENYTLLSALREFLDGYNCSIKLSFGELIDQEHFGDDNLHIVSCSFNIVSKTGNSSVVLNEDSFGDVKETKTIDKNSYGTSVISNAENVISTKSKTFPTTGSVRLSALEYNIVGSNAVLRLPSNAYKVNWLKCYFPLQLVIRFGAGAEPTESVLMSIVANNNKSIENAKTTCLNAIDNTSVLTASEKESAKSDFNSNWDTLKQKIIKAGTISFYNGNTLDPTSGVIVKADSVPYIPKISFSIEKQDSSFRQVILADKETRDCLPIKEQGIYWERGSNLIRGFDFIKTKVAGGFSQRFTISWTSPNYSTDLQSESKPSWEFRAGVNDYVMVRFGIYGTTPEIELSKTSWVANYVPMSDLKVKYDNSETSKDTQLYNQNGKLTDSNALSKLLLSYSKEIENGNITKFGTFYTSSLLDIPNVGDLVSLNGTTYVINNVSLDFYENEINPNNDSDKGYYVVGEFTLSKKIAVKSLMTNPNTNIRDYGIPQNNNVVRKQLYRDFYELSKTSDSLADTNYYLTLDKVLNLSNYYKAYQEHIAVIKIGYSSPIGGGGTDPEGNPTEASENWYYQLDTTTYMLKKAIYEVVNFNDNNIIGYSSQSVISGFFIERIFSGLTDNRNTPISYVDNSGELESIEIAMTTLGQLTNIYTEYQAKEEQLDPQHRTYDGDLLNYSIFIPSDIYEGFEMSSQVSITNHTTSALNPTHATVGGQRVTRYNYNLVDNNLVPEDFTGSTSDITISNVSAVDENDNSVNIDSVSVLTGFVVRFQIQDDISSILRITFDISYTYGRHINGAKDSNDFMISELEYNKDALEVPFFEYSCQIDDSDDIIVGENVLDTNEGDKYLYSYYLVDSGIVNENNYLNLIQMEKVFANVLQILEEKKLWLNNHSARLRYDNNSIKVSLYGYCEVYFNRENVDYQTQVTLSESLFNNKDLIIVRHKVDSNTGGGGIIDQQIYLDTTNDLMFVIKGIKDANISNNEVVININHYNVK